MEYFFNFWTTFVNLLKTFTIFDAIDISVITWVVFKAIKLIRETQAWQILKGILILLAIYLIAQNFHLTMLDAMLTKVFQFGVLALLIIFQPEVRHTIECIGRSNLPRGLSKTAYNNITQGYILKCINEIVDAAMMFQKTKTGALIVFERETKLGEVISTGTTLDAKPSARLISNIFFNKSPLHDGAMIIRDGVVYAAGCILPLTKQAINQDLGTRHRAAVGISEVSDAVVLVVSEETGNISLVTNGILTRDYDKESLTKKLSYLLIPADSNNNSIFHSIISKAKKGLRK